MIHLVGLPHTPYDAVGASTCAFTGKAVRLARMLRSRGIDTTVYWGGNLADISLLTVEEQNAYFGPWDPNELPKVQWDPQLDYWQLFHSRAVSAIGERIQPGDIVAGLVGSIHQQLFDAFPNHTCIEPGVGYEGLARNTFACFESSAWMHNRYGALGIGDGRFFDTVIPNAVDPDDWATGNDHGYLLYVGRMIARKGITLAAEIAKAVGLPLRMAGAGVTHHEPGRIVCTDGTVIDGDHITYVGAVTGETRRDLYAHASALLMPTLYIEPWGGVAAEAAMSGVAPVTTDTGGPTDWLPDAYRFRTLAEAVTCVRRAQSDRGAHWRAYATRRFGIDSCADDYATWHDRLLSLRDGRNGFYA